VAQAARTVETVGYGRGLLAGIGAGIVAALACIATKFVTHAPLPPSVPTGLSAFVAGIVGGLLYAWLSRISKAPALGLWIITLILATLDSVLISTLSLPEGSWTVFGVPIIGLVVPIKQVLALIGIGHFGTRHFPAPSLPTDTAVHYVTAVVVSLLVPWWARGR
jgi:hypothetical protein